MSSLLEKLLPTFISIGILLAITFFREKSRIFASILAIVPVNIVLGLIILQGKLNSNSSALAPFVWNMTLGILGTLLWLLTAYAILKNGGNLWLAIPLGYLAFAGWIALLWRLGWLVR